eukprot:gene22316-29389_t
MSFTEEELKLAQADATGDIQAWYMDDSTDDQRLPHKLEPDQPAPLDVLKKLGVLYWRVDADNHDTDPKLSAIRKVRNYSYKIITITPEKLPNYEEKIKSFYEEHIHEDEEIRCILDGSGYFDVRDEDDKWIRIDCRKGDLIVLPEGIYHRFTLDSANYITALRLFVGAPIWTPHNRPQEENASRMKYVDAFIKPTAAA